MTKRLRARAGAVPPEETPVTPYPAAPVSTGIPALDPVLDHIRIGDNVVWQVGDVEDYARFARPFAAAAVAAGRRVVYLRFARHRPLLDVRDGVHVEPVDAQMGFEQFSQQVRRIADREGRLVFYVFDMLSDLLQAWATDLMVGNFFRITCPRLFTLDTVAYFGLLRNSHSYQTVARIRETTQVLLEVYNADGTLCVHPVKVWNRSSPTMFLPHIIRDDRVEPVFRSAEASALFSAVSFVGFPTANRGLDSWERLFVKASETYERARSGDPDAQREARTLVEPLCRLLLGRDERMLALARDHFTLADLLAVKSRLVGSGHIGGKAVGMLLARKMVEQEFHRDARPAPLELHDSYYIGSDVFYTYLVNNDLWHLRMEQRRAEKYFSAAGELRQRLLTGTLPEELREQLMLMLEYFGQSPIIVRSSSLLEDSFGNAFAGKYESIYCVNQGTLEQRYAAFERAVKRVYASTMNPDALVYRQQRGLQEQDEQMALLVQRVSGNHRGVYFFPDAAGVGLSYSTYVWTPTMDPRAGMLRMVFGLGTRAVGRAENDYARLVFLDDPAAQPFGPEDAALYAQRRADVLSIARNRLETVPVDEALGCLAGESAAVVSRSSWTDPDGRAHDGWIVDFEQLLARTDFVPCMQRMLATLERGYRYPVEIEFTVNLDTQGAYKVNLLQCRPLQTKGIRAGTAPVADVPRERLLLRTVGGFMGGNIHQRIARVITVDTAAYAAAPLSLKYRVARTVGRLNRLADRDRRPTMLIAPGRLGTTTPSLGLPVAFAEISAFAALCEVADPAKGFAPELSFGSHFFQDLVEMDMFYLALFPDRPGTIFERGALCPPDGNALRGVLPDAAVCESLVYVRDFDPDAPVYLASNITTQTACMFFADQRTEPSATLTNEVHTHAASR